MIKYVLLLGIIFCLACSKKEPVTITIVDIAHLDRVGLAKQIKIINKHSPRVIGLDFLLTTDSLDKDIALSEELARTPDMIQATTLHNSDPEDITNWDSLDQYHPKFRFGDQGFSNITITRDSVIVPRLPMRQYYRDNTVLGFSYLIAARYDRGRIAPKYNDGDHDFSFDEESFGGFFKVISAKDLFAGNFDKNDLTDKIVLMGHVSDKEDSFYLDDSRTKRISGVEVHACVIREILE
jgi:CHASE2 domain-containing sensor protein